MLPAPNFKPFVTIIILNRVQANTGLMLYRRDYLFPWILFDALAEFSFAIVQPEPNLFCLGTSCYQSLYTLKEQLGRGEMMENGVSYTDTIHIVHIHLDS